MKILLTIATISLLASWVTYGQVARKEEDGLVPFSMDWEKFGNGDLDLSFLKEKPAGEKGFITIRKGHFYSSSGKRFRIWGVNLTGGACFPEKKDAEKVAIYLSRMGINAVRFHFLDSNWGDGRSLFPAKGTSTRVFDPEQVDKLDFFVSKLKEHGIYSNFNLNVGRTFREDDEVPYHQLLGIAKAVTLFDDRIIALEKEHALHLLTHINPYTGKEYRQEPALAFLELVNENSLVEAWYGNRLNGSQTTTQTSTWSDIPPYYADELTRKYNDWLRKNVPEIQIDSIRKEAGTRPDAEIPRLKPDEFSKASKLRFHTEAKFIMETENNFYSGMYRYLKDTVKVNQLVAANSDHSHYKSGYALLSSTSKLDFVDGHVYWQHPNYFPDPVTRKQNFTIENTPMVNDPEWSTVAQLARSAVLGKPYTVSETNHPYPNSWSCEGIVTLAAYGLLQDWDGIYLYTFEHDDPSLWKTRVPGYFDIQHDPLKMANLAAGAVLFIRGDVKPAKTTVIRNYTENDLVEGIRKSTGTRPFFTPGLPSVTPLVYKTRIGSFQGGENHFPEIPQKYPIVAATNELIWGVTGKEGIIILNTPRTQALIGFSSGMKDTKMGNLKVKPDNKFCSVIVTSLDGKQIKNSKKLLLSATSYSQLTGMVRTDNRKSLIDWGHPPFRIEPFSGTVSLFGLHDNSGFIISPLDGSGKKMKSNQTGKADKDSWSFRAGNPGTVWYMLEK